MVARAVMAWSGGKDSAVALWRLMEDPAFQVTGLLTTVTEGYDRISMHGVRVSLLEAQAEALQLELHKVSIPPAASNEVYQAAMGRTVSALTEDGVEAMGFGDLYLEDIRAYREKMLAPTGLNPVFPIWGEETARLARELIEAGFEATLCCVDPRVLAPSFVGRAFDLALLADLPATVDPCGENGEFHTFVNTEPNFQRPIPVTVGERVEREGFWFADLLPAAPGP